VNPDTDLIEIVELPEKRWFIGVQFHPEYKTKVGRPHPLFRSFITAAAAYARQRGLMENPQPARPQKVVPLASAEM